MVDIKMVAPPSAWTGTRYIVYTKFGTEIVVLTPVSRRRGGLQVEGQDSTVVIPFEDVLLAADLEHAEKVMNHFVNLGPPAAEDKPSHTGFGGAPAPLPSLLQPGGVEKALARSEARQAELSQLREQIIRPLADRERKYMHPQTGVCLFRVYAHADGSSTLDLSPYRQYLTNGGNEIKALGTYDTGKKLVFSMPADELFSMSVRQVLDELRLRHEPEDELPF